MRVPTTVRCARDPRCRVADTRQERTTLTPLHDGDIMRRFISGRRHLSGERSMQCRTWACGVFIVLVLTACRGWTADTDSGFQAAKQAFFKEMKKKSAVDRAEGVTAFAEFAHTETAELLLKKGLGDSDLQVRIAAQKGLAKLADDAEVCKFLFDDLKRSLRKPGAENTVAELLRALAGIEDESLQQELVKHLDDYLKSPKGNLLLPMTLIDDFGTWGDARAARAVALLARAKAFDAKFGYRRCVVQAMVRIREPAALDFLIDLLPHLDGLIEHDVVQYLTRLTKQKFRDNDKDWLNWWKFNRATFQFPAAKDPSPAAGPLENQQLVYYGIPICAKRVVFVLDTSGSMHGQPIETAKK